MTDSGGDSPDPLLLQELEHYRSRWKGTERTSEQRMTMLLTAVGSAIAISAADFIHSTGNNRVDSGTFLCGVWLVVTLVAEGVFIRLVRGRRAMRRDIRIINIIRKNLYDIDSKEDPEQDGVLAKVWKLDHVPPKAFLWASLPMAAGLITSCSALASVWLYHSQFKRPPGISAILFGLAVMVVNTLAYFYVTKDDS